MVKRSRATEGKEGEEGRREQTRRRLGERGRGKKCSQKWSSMNQSLPRSFHRGLYLSPVLYGLRSEKPFLDHVPTFLPSAHPCPSTLPFIINCFVRSLLCETSFSQKFLRNAIREIYSGGEI